MQGEYKTFYLPRKRNDALKNLIDLHLIMKKKGLLDDAEEIRLLIEKVSKSESDRLK